VTIPIVRDADHQFWLAVSALDDFALATDHEVDRVQQFRLAKRRFEGDHGVAQPPNEVSWMARGCWVLLARRP
jgi:hypothetical protein